jgi:hypothetical protein
MPPHSGVHVAEGWFGFFSIPGRSPACSLDVFLRRAVAEIPEDNEGMDCQDEGDRVDNRFFSALPVRLRSRNSFISASVEKYARSSIRPFGSRVTIMLSCADDRVPWHLPAGGRKARRPCSSGRRIRFFSASRARPHDKRTRYRRRESRRGPLGATC